MKTRLALPLAALLALGEGLACHKPKTGIYAGETSDQLLEKGRALVKRGKFTDARTLLRYIESNMPGTKAYPEAKLLLGDSFFFQGSASYPEALVEYTGFLTYFPNDARRDYALYQIALCHYAAIDSAERDQTETRAAIQAFSQLLRESPGSLYALEAKDRITQCWRRIAEHDLVVGIFYVNSYNYPGAQQRLTNLMETYPDFVDRERAYYYLGETLRQRGITPDELETWSKGELTQKFGGKETYRDLDKDQQKQMAEDQNAWAGSLVVGWRQQAKDYYQRLVESYPNSEWARHASDRLVEMGQTGLKEELDM
ncbi:MAG TPA: outer membrane protein assembly factor BamD [Holophagaceae bacterium]|jgi:outer membrane protein assembly factor BamD|nr:outer membrane protein assembly factor BamD [Holophagaceae bacterium]